MCMHASTRNGFRKDCANGADMKTTFHHVEVPISITFTIQIDFENCAMLLQAAVS